MENIFRGWVEKEIDRLLQPEFIKNIAEISKNFPMQSAEDFCFAYIAGFVSAGSHAQAIFYFRREMNLEEWNEVMKIINRRVMEIRGKIKLALGK